MPTDTTPKATAHTPGPWHYEALGEGRYSVYHNGPLAYCGNTSMADGDGEANARLIAAAPDLLAAMQALFKECAMIHRYGGEICNQREADAAIAAARAAIARATGE